MKLKWQKPDKNGIRHCNAGRYQGWYRKVECDCSAFTDDVFEWGIVYFRLDWQMRCSAFSDSYLGARKDCSGAIREFIAQDEFILRIQNNSK